MSNAIKVSTSCTTGWTDWVHGDLWLLEDGLLRIASDVAATFRASVGPAILWHGPRMASITPEEAGDLAARNRKNVWVPRHDMVSADLRRGVLTDRLGIVRTDGSAVKLLWMRDDASPLLEERLREWLGGCLQLA